MIQDITIEELKNKYSDRPGFVFFGAVDSNPKFCAVAAEQIQKNDYSETLPEFVGKLNNRTYVFVYPEGSSLQTPALMQYANNAGLLLNAFKIDSLSAWLKEA